MRPEIISSSRKKNWAILSVLDLLRRRQFRILGLRETVWCYAVGTITATCLLWQPARTLSEPMATQPSDLYQVSQVQVIDNQEHNTNIVALNARSKQANPRMIGKHIEILFVAGDLSSSNGPRAIDTIDSKTSRSEP